MGPGVLVAGKTAFTPFSPPGRLAESTCYLITVTPVYSDGPGAAEAVRAYLKQARKSPSAPRPSLKQARPPPPRPGTV